MTATGACPMCGTGQHACGEQAPVVAVDIASTTPREIRTVGDLNEYEVLVNGHVTTMQLTEKDAKAYPDARRLGAETTEGARADTANDAEDGDANGDAEAEPDAEADDASSKAKGAQNKARPASNRGRSAQNKSAGDDSDA